MDETNRRNYVANVVAEKLLLLEERKKIADNLLERTEIKEEHKHIVRRLLSQMLAWCKTSITTSSKKTEELECGRRLVNELMEDMAYLFERYDSIGVSGNDNRVLKLCSEYGSHVLPLPKSYAALMEMVDKFYGIPQEDGFVFVVSFEDIHISGDFELEYVYGKHKDVEMINLLVTTARSCKRRKIIPISPAEPNPNEDSAQRSWIRSEQRLLDDAVCKFGIDDWEIISRHVKTRTAEACRARYRRQRRQLAKRDTALPIVKDFASSYLNLSNYMLSFSSSTSELHRVSDESLKGEGEEEEEEKEDQVYNIASEDEEC